MLFLAGALNKQILDEKHEAELALEQGPPVIVDLDSYSAKEHRGPAREMHIRAEIDISDNFSFTIITNGVLKDAKYFVPLYAPTETLSDQSEAKTAAFAKFLTNKDEKQRLIFNKSGNKILIGAIVSKDEDTFKNAMDFTVGYGQIGPIITVNGQPGSFGGKHEDLAKETLEDLGIRYVKDPVYIKAFFGNRATVLQDQTINGKQSNPLYVIAYFLMAVGFARMIW